MPCLAFARPSRPEGPADRVHVFALAAFIPEFVHCPYPACLSLGIIHELCFCRARLLCPLASKRAREQAKRPLPDSPEPARRPIPIQIPKAWTKPYRLVDIPSSRSATRTPKPDALSLAYIYVTATALHSRTATKPSSRPVQPPFRHPIP